ncbi:hypothetical protein EW146_g7619 [Bondarzewia mesenterica]|uniref:Uncharacterized protein n=1 Tax=Bondarzewia mesenterica TaxID=1095465 RepID=A0A4V3XE69_9AGAM|nr:hypothetical protein EW146_g7619 [Bondarzewia mesenterica]
MSTAAPTPLQSFLGGIGLALPVHTLLMFNGSVFGISGFLHRAVKGNIEGAASVLGLVLGGVVLGRIEGTGPMVFDPSLSRLIASGLLVGLGTKLGSGCTSGHMICGLSRFSIRSLVATAAFFTTGVLTTHVLHAGALPTRGAADLSLGKFGGALLFSSGLSLLGAVLARYLLPPPASSANEPDPKRTSTSHRLITSFLTALSFSFSLHLSNLTSPLRVLSFLMLPPSPSFDPSLAFLAMGALPLATVLYRKWGRPLCPVTNTTIDWRLVTGGALFGIGWGIEGICPGPGLVNFGQALATGSGIQPLAIWLASLVAGGLLVQ